MDPLKEDLQKWLFDPVLGRIVTTLLGLIILHVILRFMHRSLEMRFGAEGRYRVHKIIKMFGYLASAVLVIAVFSDYLGRWTVALGVAGAGVAVALQEVIASVAGWVGISFGNFFTTGDRVQLGGITGDVIDIGILRTTIMETGQWVKGDQYNGRIVRIANSFVFKEPVFNYTADFPFVWDEIMVPIHTGGDYLFARNLLLKIAHEVVGDYTKVAEKKWQAMKHKYLIEHAVVEPMVLMAVTTTGSSSRCGMSPTTSNAGKQRIACSRGYWRSSPRPTTESPSPLPRSKCSARRRRAVDGR